MALNLRRVLGHIALVLFFWVIYVVASSVNLDWFYESLPSGGGKGMSFSFISTD